jgi:hypothetical protein
VETASDTIMRTMEIVATILQASSVILVPMKPLITGGITSSDLKEDERGRTVEHSDQRNWNHVPIRQEQVFAKR